MASSGWWIVVAQLDMSNNRAGIAGTAEIDVVTCDTHVIHLAV
jgi:hypothetical protein